MRNRISRRPRLKPARFFAAGATIALLLAGLAAAPASAETRNPAPVQDSVDEAEAAIKAFNETGRVPGSALPDHDFSQEAPAAVFELADSLRERYEETEGYGVVEWSKKDRAALVWWHGDVPDDVTELIAGAAKSAGIPVTVASMPYSALALKKAAVVVAPGAAIRA